MYVHEGFDPNVTRIVHVLLNPIFKHSVKPKLDLNGLRQRGLDGKAVNFNF
jgi:hypothetical protein